MPPWAGPATTHTSHHHVRPRAVAAEVWQLAKVLGHGVHVAAEIKRWSAVEHLLPSRFLEELPAADPLGDGSDPDRESAERDRRGRGHIDAIAALFEK